MRVNINFKGDAKQIFEDGFGFYNLFEGIGEELEEKSEGFSTPQYIVEIEYKEIDIVITVKGRKDV